MFTLLLMEKGYTLHVHTAGGGKGYRYTLQVHIAWQWKETHPAHPYCWQWKGYTLHVHSAEVGKLYTLHIRFQCFAAKFAESSCFMWGQAQIRPKN
jgi:hypothetical protein